MILQQKSFLSLGAPIIVLVTVSGEAAKGLWLNPFLQKLPLIFFWTCRVSMVLGFALIQSRHLLERVLC